MLVSLGVQRVGRYIVSETDMKMCVIKYNYSVYKVVCNLVYKM